MMALSGSEIEIENYAGLGSEKEMKTEISSTNNFGTIESAMHPCPPNQPISSPKVRIQSYHVGYSFVLLQVLFFLPTRQWQIRK